MLRSNLVRVLALMVCLGLFVTMAYAVPGVVVSPPEKGTVEIKIGDKVEKITLKGVKLFDKGGAAIKGKDAGDALKKDVKVDVKKDGDKVIEIKVE